MGYRPHPPSEPMLFGYDPDRDLPADHLARLVESVVEESVPPPSAGGGVGRPGYDPRLCVKVLVYAYATGVRSSRRMERSCAESMPYLFLTRGETPSYRTLCSVRANRRDLLESVWVGLFAVAARAGVRRLGRIAVDSTKLRADAGPESVVRRDEFDATLVELARVLAEAEEVDRREDEDGGPASTRIGGPVDSEQMRDILRRVRRTLAAKKRSEREDGVPPEAGAAPKRSEPKSLTPEMLARVAEAKVAIQRARDSGLKHISVTDPDARMMGEGREKRVRECHSFEVAVDHGLIVAGGSSQENADSRRLSPLVEAAGRNEPDGVSAVVGDSGYYSGDGLAALIEAGVDTCIPDPMTAADIHRGLAPGATRDRARGSVPLAYDAGNDRFDCPEGNTLAFVQRRPVCGQIVRIYRARRECVGCPQAPECLSQATAKRRTHSVGEHSLVLDPARRRFGEPDHLARYHHRGPDVETIFGFLRGVLGYMRWTLRGSARVACEATLFKLAYQFRKLHTGWRPQRA